MLAEFSGTWILKVCLAMSIFLSVVEGQSSENTLLHSTNVSLSKDVECEIAVFVNFKKAQLEIIRLESRKRKKNLSLFLKSPDKFEGVGEIFALQDLFPEIDVEKSLNKVEARFLLGEGERQLEVKGHMEKGQVLSIQKDIATFFQNGVSCL